MNGTDAHAELVRIAKSILREHQQRRARSEGSNPAMLRIIDKSIALATSKLLCQHTTIVSTRFRQTNGVLVESFKCADCKISTRLHKVGS